MRYIFCVTLLTLSLLTACSEVKEKVSTFEAKADFGPGPDGKNEIELFE